MIIRKATPIRVVTDYPQTDTGKKELVQRIADVHSDVLCRRLKSQVCPAGQKLKLLDAVIQTLKNQNREPA